MTGFIVILALIVSMMWVYAADKLYSYIHDKSEEKTEKRRAVYRRAAYQAVSDRRVKTQNRRDLWRVIEK